ncbi:phage tail assembly protein [Acinetobacter sp. ULE_I010]|uniref:phage tail assembly protein n=1 Tax=Acinetobacter sp. ULE_I010 TaxID=3373065 RepID=UPI003AF569A5
MTSEAQKVNQDAIKPTSKLVSLETGIQLGDNLIKEITVIKPNTGHFRGVSIRRLQDLYPEELAVFLPRVTKPAIPSEILMQMEFEDFMELAGKALSFLGEGKDKFQNESSQ